MRRVVRSSVDGIERAPISWGRSSPSHWSEEEQPLSQVASLLIDDVLLHDLERQRCRDLSTCPLLGTDKVVDAATTILR